MRGGGLEKGGRGKELVVEGRKEYAIPRRSSDNL